MSDKPLDFSSESFGVFQVRLKNHVATDSLLWVLRDGLFRTLFHDPLSARRLIRTKDAMLVAPAGWIPWFILRLVHAKMKGRDAIPEPELIGAHLLFLSPRSNHLKRIHPLFKEMTEEFRCRAWITHPALLELIDRSDQESFHFAPDAWTKFLKPADLWRASRAARQLDRILPASVTQIQRSMVRVYIATFLAWKRFWNKQLVHAPELVLTTYEKDPIAKALFAVAFERGVPRRIHWAHSLRHASLQATLASELWCMTELDVRYYHDPLPGHCRASYKENPESAELIRTIGRVDDEELQGLETINFLVLGSGFDAAYTPELSREDMGVIKTAMSGLGNRVNWRFRPHPGNIPAFRADMDAHGLAGIALSNNTLNEDLQWAHAVASTFSSLLVDVRPTGRKIFWLHEEIRPLYGVDDLIREGYGIQLDSSTAVARIRQAFGWTENPSPSPENQP